jgi:hypothetical protein
MGTTMNYKDFQDFKCNILLLYSAITTVCFMSE